MMQSIISSLSDSFEQHEDGYDNLIYFLPHNCSANSACTVPRIFVVIVGVIQSTLPIHLS